MAVCSMQAVNHRPSLTNEVLPLTESPLRDPEFLERYELGARIAAGGFGDIYRATQRSTGQAVAVKTLRLEGAGEGVGESAERFRRETRLCAALHHPNIVRLIDSGRVSSGSFYAVFDLLRGNNLADVLAAEGALEPAEVLHLMSQVLDALACAHAEGIVHRDLKPANVMVTDTGARRNAMVLDFGLGTFTTAAALGDPSRLTQRGDYLGTPAYSAPEQLRGDSTSSATDLFAWGLISVECLTGRPVLEGTVPQVIHRQLGPDPIPIPAAILGHELGRILAAVIEKDPARREGSAQRVLADLQKIGADSLPGREALDGSRGVRAPASRAPRGVPELSRIWLVPLRRNPNFTGREAILDELAGSLQERGLLGIAALRGLGGVGKTQLALEYAYRHAGEYDLVAWLRAGEPETLAEDYAGLAEDLGLPERETPDQRRKIEAVRAWLERSQGWLVVFDNAPNPDSIRHFLPRTTAGHILVTSRHQSWREVGSSVAVEELEPDEAVEFILTRTGQADREGAARLAEELGRLPLALEKAAAYLDTTGRSVRAYLPLLRDQRKILLATPGLPDYPETLHGAWEISFRQVEEEVPEAADLLRLCGFLAPDDIPLELLRAGGEQLPPALAEAVGDPIRFDECVAALRRYSLVKVEEDSLSVHRMVQLVTRERLGEQEKPRWAERALRLAEAAFPSSGLEGDFEPEAGRYLPHALAALSHVEPLPSSAVHAGRLLNRIGNYLSARGLHEQGRQHLESGLALFEQGPEPRESEAADLLADLGLVLFALGELEGARKAIERALETHERLLGPDHFQLATDLMELSWVLRAEGDLERVRTCCERALAIVEATVGPGHSLAAMGLSILCRAFWSLGRIEEARWATDQALDILRESELYHPLMCSCWYNLGQAQLDLGNLDSADECIARALEIGERAYGPDHPLTAVSMAVRGAIQDRRGLLEDARKSFEQSLAGAERTCNWLHEEIAIARIQLGDVLRRLGEPEEASRKLLHARGQMERLCGERSRFGSHVEAAAAALLADQEDLEQARVHANRASSILDARYGPDHPYRISLLTLLARIERASGAPGKAAELTERALSIGAAAFGDRHPDLADTHAVAALLAAERGDAEAESLHLDRARVLRSDSSEEGPLAPRRRSLRPMD